MRGCRTPGRSSIPLPTTAPPPVSPSAVAPSGRSMSTCAGSAASCTAIPRSRRPDWRRAFSATRHSVSPGLPTRSASTATRLNRAISCWPAPSPASSSRRRGTRCTPTLARSADWPSSSCEGRPMTFELQRNAFKHAIAAGQLQIGLWSSLCSNIAAEIIGDAGFDWILLDTEHSPNEVPGLLSQLQAIGRGGSTPIVRPAWNDAVLAKHALDIGAQTLLFPYVQNAEEARRAVASTRYPPEGIRGVAVASRASRFGRTPGYLTKANIEMCVLIQVETRSALDELEAIASVDGVDGV